MKFGYIGIDYKHADQDIRDRVSFTDNQKIDFLQKAGKAGIEQCFVLSTCNRSEVYFFAPEEIAQPLGVIRTLYEEMFPGVDFSEYLKQREEMDAISYLFRVTAGLESMVLGCPALWPAQPQPNPRRSLYAPGRVKQRQHNHLRRGRNSANAYCTPLLPD